MRHIVLRVVFSLLGFFLVASVALLVTIRVRQHRTFDAPLPDVHAQADPAVVARGKYLAEGPAHCTGCHGEALSGGVELKIPIGTFRSPNLTPDLATGIGARADGLIARALRHGVGHDGRALMPFMPFAHLSEEDLVAVISYLRAIPAVRHEVRPTDLNLIGMALKAFVIEPVGPTREVRAVSPTGATVERGRYLAYDVANCVGCHTERDMKTGAFIGPHFAGGFKMGELVSRNLTPDVKTGWIRSWSEDQFVDRFRTGIGMEGSHMPWAAFAKMSEDDLRAVYRFLQTVQPVERDTRTDAEKASVPTPSAQAPRG